MNLLQVNNLSKAYGEKQLFHNVNFGINQGQKVAFIAQNGMGKTSLLNIIMGIDIQDEGDVVIRKDIKISYLAQNPVFNNDQTIFEAVLDSENELFSIIKSYEDALEQLSVDDSDAAQDALQIAMAAMDIKSAWDYENKIKEVLFKLKISNLNQKVKSLSGGQRRKLALAKSLIEDVDLLLLDEPTNHLDIDMIEWLEKFLKGQKLSLLVVTHDRYFLDSVCDEIYELEYDGIYRYRGNYNYYVEKKAERIAIEISEQEKAQNLMRKEQEWMRRMPKARTTKSKARIDSFYDLEKKAKKVKREEVKDFKVKVSRIGNKILEVNHINKSFDENLIIKNFSHTFTKGERIGVVGPNGAGKSTFFNLVMGNIKPDKGSIVKGQTMVFGYFTQTGLNIKEDKRLIDIVKDVADEIPFGTSSTLSAAQFLHYFNFDYSTQHNYYRNLSGGEKRRLQLMLVFINNPNFLILDEPTNDLDIDTLNVLEEFLINYPGCLMVTTHDRAFLDSVVDHLFVFEGNGVVKDYHSNYSEYRALKRKKEREIKKIERSDKNDSYKKPKETKKKASFKEKQEFEQLNGIIETLTERKEELTELLNGGNGTPDDFTQWSIQFNDTSDKLDENELRWLELSEIIE
ncbi:MAG: ABC-F family ATP-binding cassette domain-containing protein [Bacteroidales bacterium]|nr:ABC-F family ATP-binding cassette domain-containing protein [Bacteroidales bacterium]